nr:PREDICTED: seizure protein 6 homolog [Lepisosteus oculatus]
MCPKRDYRLNVYGLLLIFGSLLTETRGQGKSRNSGGVAGAAGGHSPFPTPQDPEGEISPATTAPPVSFHSHHPLLGEFIHERLLKKDFLGQQHFFSNGEAAGRPTLPTADSYAGGDPSTKLVPHEDAPAFSDIATTTTMATTSPMTTMATTAQESAASLAQSGAGKNQGRPTEMEMERVEMTLESLTTPVIQLTASNVHGNSPALATPTGEGPVSTGGVTAATSLAVSALTESVRSEAAHTQQPIAEQNMGTASEITAMTSSSSSGETDEETTTTTIITTTIITTMQTPVPCNSNFTAPEGYIESPRPSSVWYYSSMDCTYSVTSFLGYGVEIQVLNVSLSEGETVTLEDLGGREPSVLANESILTKGLVVRSWSNQIAIRFQSEQQPRPGSFLLRYQDEGESSFVDSVSFYPPHRPLSPPPPPPTLFPCPLTPAAACGGVVRNATVGRIVSPGFPGNYSNNLTCHWVLEAPEGQRLHVHFEKVALAEDDDRLLIKNGNNIDSAPVYDSYEVEYLPIEGLVSSSRHFFVELTTDGSGTSTGAALRYEAFAPGHCYEPFVKYGNFTSSDVNYPVGTVVEFACDPGYTLEQGSIIIECVDPNNPQWNETEPACRAVCSGEITDSAGVVLSPNWPEAYDKGQDCIWGIHVEEDKRIMLDIQMLHVGKNDVLTFYDGDDLTAKILGQYSGTHGRFKLYTSMADVTIQFQSDPATNIFGYHNGFVIHFFEVPRNDTCPELPEIPNGWKTTSHPELIHGTVVTYQCYPGYDVVGTEILMCQWDLTWSGDLPSCEKVVTCADPGTAEHSRRVMSGPRFTVGSTVQYVCNKGYVLSGNSLLTCYSRDSGSPKWSERLPKCVGKCEPPSPDRGRLRQRGCLCSFLASSSEYLNERRLDVAKASADYPMEGTNIAIAVLIPVVIIAILIMGMYLYFSKVQGKSLRLPLSTSHPYDHITVESAFDNPIYETGVSTDSMHLRDVDSQNTIVLS